MSIESTIRQFRPEKHNLLMILHALQNSHPKNYLTEEALSNTARYLGLTKSAVYGVASYYSMFSLTPRGKYIIRVCVSPVCELLKAKEVVGILEKELGITTGQTTPCGLFTLEHSECLGQCQEAPSMMINEKVYNQLDANRINDILQGFRQHKP